MRGGPRKGAGRKPTGSTQVILSVKIDPKILADLRSFVPRGQRSHFVAKAIAAYAINLRNGGRNSTRLQVS